MNENEEDDFFWDQEFFGDYETYGFDDENYENDSYERYRKKIPTPPVTFPCVQLAAMNSRFKTLQEVRIFYQRQAEEAEEKRKKEEIADKISRETSRKTEEQNLKAMLLSLPTESQAGKESRLAKEAEEKRMAGKTNTIYKPLPFGHRRNGGGKRQSHTVVDQDIVRARRADRRHVRKAEKKKEEANRAEFFKKEEEAQKEKEEKEEKKEKDEEDEEEEKDEEAEEIMISLMTFKDLPSQPTWETQEKEKQEEEDKKEQQRLAKKQEEDSWIQVPVRKKHNPIEPIVLKMGIQSYKTQSNPEIKESKNTRKEARENLENTKEGQLNSRMCNSVGSGEPCRHGERCRFAHSIEQLSPTKCFFGNECKFLDCTHRTCNFIHPCEDKLAYCKRTGINTVLPKSSPKITEKKEEPKKMAGGNFEAPKITGNAWDRSFIPATPEWTTVKRKECKEKTKRPLCRSVGTGKPCPHGATCRFSHPQEKFSIGEEKVLRVPKELVQEAMQLAMQSGDKKVRVEII